MKKILSLTALSASLLLSLPAVAADAAQPGAPAKTVEQAAKPAPPPSDMLEALTALGNELRASVGSGKGNPIPVLDKLAAHGYSDVTRARVSKVFGRTEPLTIARSAAAPGMVGFTLAAPAHSYTDSNAATTAWSDLAVNLLLDKDGRNMTTSGTWQSFSITEKDTSMTMSEMRIAGNSRRNARDMWLGKAQIDIGAVAIMSDKQGSGALLEGISIATNTAQRGAAIDVSYDARIKALKAGGEQFDALRMALRVTNIDMRAMEKMTAAFSENAAGVQTPAQQIDKAMQQFKAMGKSLSTRGSALEIDEIGIGLRGNRAIVKGKVTLAPGTDADLASAAALSKKVVARLNVRVPVALVTDMAKAFMASDAKSKGKPISADELSQAAQTVTDVMVGKLLNGGFAKLDKGVLLSLIEFKGGQLTFNGKQVALPKTAVAPAQPADKTFQ